MIKFYSTIQPNSQHIEKPLSLEINMAQSHLNFDKWKNFYVFLKTETLISWLFI